MKDVQNGNDRNAVGSAGAFEFALPLLRAAGNNIITFVIHSIPMGAQRGRLKPFADGIAITSLRMVHSEVGERTPQDWRRSAPEWRLQANLG